MPSSGYLSAAHAGNLGRARLRAHSTYTARNVGASRTPELIPNRAPSRIENDERLYQESFRLAGGWPIVEVQRWSSSLAASEELMARVEDLVARRADLVARLRDVGWELPDAQGNFVWFPLGDRALDFAAACGEVGISVRPFAGDGVPARAPIWSSRIPAKKQAPMSATGMPAMVPYALR